MITIKSCNEFGRVISSTSVAHRGGVNSVANQIAAIAKRSGAFGVHIVITTRDQVMNPTRLYDALAEPVKATGVDRVKLTISSDHHNVTVGVHTFTPLALY